MNPENLVEVKKGFFVFFLFFIILNNISFAQHWQNIEDSSHPRVESINALVDGKLYIFSGFTEFSNNILKISGTSELFNPDLIGTNSGPWKILGSMPHPVTHTGAVVVDKTIWIAGGFEGNDPGVAINKVQIYDTKTESWSFGPEIPEKMASHAIVKAGNNIHIFGGLKPDRKTDNDAHYVLDLNNLEKGWKTATKLPSPRNHLSGATVSGKIYAIGGQHGHDGGFKDVKLVHEYDPLTNKWTRKADLPIERSHFEPGTITIDGKIIIVGGRHQYNKNILDNITEFDPRKNVWKELPPLPTSLLAPNAKIINNKLYVTHGGKFWDAPLKSAFVKIHESSGKDSLGFSPNKVVETIKGQKSLTKRSIIWTLNKKVSYSIKQDQLPQWIKINNSEADGQTDPDGRFINIELNSNGLAPGIYTYNIVAEAQGYSPAVLPITLQILENLENNVIRINSGGEDFNFNNLSYKKDNFYSESKSFVNENLKEVHETELDKIYLSERSSLPTKSSFSYNIPVQNGNYKVLLHFAEIYWGAPGGGSGGIGKRVFNVNLEGGPAELINYDIFKEVGAMTASIKEFVVVVNDGILNIDFSASKDQPKISAIEVIPYDNVVHALKFKKNNDAINLSVDSTSVINNIVYTSNNTVTPISITATDGAGNHVTWLKIKDLPAQNYETFSDEEINFKVEPAGLHPGLYEAIIVAAAKDFIADQYKIILNVLPKEELAPPAIVVETQEIMFNSTFNIPTQPYLLKIQNQGASSLKIDSVKLEGEQSSEFRILNFPETGIEITGSQYFNLEVLYLPKEFNSSEVSLIIFHNDPSKDPATVLLYGSATEDPELREPSLGDIFNILGFNIETGFSGLQSDPQIFPVGDEIIAPLFKKTGKDDIKIEILSTYAPIYPLHFGSFKYTRDDAEYPDTEILLELQEKTKSLSSESQEGEINFIPSSDFFGFFVKLSEQFFYSDDFLNLNDQNETFHAARVYPVKDRTGNVLENQYIYTFDVDADGDFQDLIIKVSNVVPVPCIGNFEIEILEVKNPSCGEQFGSIVLDEIDSSLEFKLGDTGFYQKSGIFTELIPGTYSIFARDIIQKCETVIYFNIEEPQNLLDFAVESQSVSCGNYNDGSAKILNIIGGSPPYTIYWNEQISNMDFAEGLFPGTYTITVMDESGCKNEKEFIINKSECATTALYRETFSNPSDEELPTDETNWFAFKGTTGERILNSTHSNTRVFISSNKGKNKEHSIKAGPTLDSLKGFLAGYNHEATPVFVYTEEYSVDLKKYNINSFRWIQGHSSEEFKSRLVISIDGNWFINKHEIKNLIPVDSDDDFSNNAEEIIMNFSLSGSEWEFFTFNPGVSMNVQKSGEIERGKSEISLPRGILNAFGVYTTLHDRGSLRFDSFSILADRINEYNEVKVDFKAQIKDDSYAYLTWKVKTDADLNHFIIEKSNDNNVYSEVEYLPALENNGQDHEYEFMDSQPLSEITTFYRLKYVDINGMEGNSEVIPLQVEGKPLSFLIYPNPVINDYLNFELQGFMPDELVTISVVDIFGRKIVERKFKTDNRGYLKQEITFNSNLPAGIYKANINSIHKPLQQQLFLRY